MFHIYSEGLELFFFLTTVFPGCPCFVAGLVFFPMVKDVHMRIILPSSSVLGTAESVTAQVFEIREIQPLRWPGLKRSFGFRFERH